MKLAALFHVNCTRSAREQKRDAKTEKYLFNLLLHFIFFCFKINWTFVFCWADELAIVIAFFRSAIKISVFALAARLMISACDSE